MTEEVQIEDVLDSQEPQEDIVREQEKMIPASEVSRHIAGAKKKAYDKAKREYEEKLRQTNEVVNQQSPGTRSDVDQMRMNNPNSDPRSMMREELEKLLQEQEQMRMRAHHENEARKILTELATKVEDAQKRIPDFKDVISQFDFTATPELLEASNLFDNSGDILYDLAKNPSKIGSLRSLAQISPTAVFGEMRKLSDSIKQNQTAKSTQFAKEPSRTFQSSNVGGDSGNLSLADLKRKYRG